MDTTYLLLVITVTVLAVIAASVTGVFAKRINANYRARKTRGVETPHSAH